MRISAPVSLVLLIFSTAISSAAETSINGTTLLRFEQRSLPGFDKQNIFPATQFISLESTGISDPNLSIHLSGWGRADFADNSSDKSSDATLSYGYLRYLFPKSNAEVKAGRIFVFEGVSSETLDGIHARTDLTNGFSVSAFGGAPVHPQSRVDNRGNSISGGRIGYSYPSVLDIGVSTLYEGGGMISGSTTKLRDTRQLVGGDLWLKPHQTVDLRGRISYDTINKGFAEQSWLMSLKTGSSSALNIDYSQYEFKELFAASAIRSLFNPDTTGGQKAAGISYTRQLAKPLEVTASFRHQDSDTKGTSNRYGAEARLSLIEGKWLSGLSYFRVAAPADVNSFHEARAYLLYAETRYSASIDGITHLYDKTINGKSNGFELQGSAGYRIKPDINLSCDLSYAQNPSYNNEVKGLVRLTFNYSAGKGGVK